MFFSQKHTCDWYRDEEFYLAYACHDFHLNEMIQFLTDDPTTLMRVSIENTKLFLKERSKLLQFSYASIPIVFQKPQNVFTYKTDQIPKSRNVKGLVSNLETIIQDPLRRL